MHMLYERDKQKLLSYLSCSNLKTEWATVAMEINNLFDFLEMYLGYPSLVFFKRKYDIEKKHEKHLIQ